MRTLAILFFFLLLTLSANCQVLDTDGEPLRPSVDYYILPSTGGGLRLAIGANQSCPTDVVQETNNTSNGFPVTFSPVNPDDQVINQGVDLNIKFSAVTICSISTVWNLESDNGNPVRYFVEIGGVEGNPGRDTLSNWFNIQSYEDAYLLNFCPTVCNICRPVCGNIGIILDNGNRRLGLSDQPLKVTFQKA